MAYVTEWKDTDLGADGGSRASFAIYNYTPILQYHLNKDGADCLYWWINGGKITASPSDNSDPDKINLNSNFTVNFAPTYTGSTSTFINGNGKDVQTITGAHNLNLITPFSATVSTGTATTTKPTSGTNTAFNVRMRFENRPWIGRWEGLDCTLSGTLYDNTFCKNLKSSSINRSYANNTGAVVISLNDTLPALQRSDAKEEIVCTNKTYTIPFVAGSRSYHLSSSYGTPSNSGNENMVSVNMSGIKLYNDTITVSCSSLGAIKSFTRNSSNPQKLEWTNVTGAKKYNIYVDNDSTPYATVSTNSWTIPDELYYDQKHTYYVEVCDVFSYSYNYRTSSGYKKVNNKWEAIDYATYYSERMTTITAKKGVNKATHSNWTDVGLIVKPTVTPSKIKPNAYSFTVSHSVTLGVAKLYYTIGANGTLNPISNNTFTLDKLKVNTKYELYFYASSTIGGKEYFSDAEVYTFTPTKLPAASFTTANATKVNVDAYSIAFTTPTDKLNKADSYNLYLNGVIIKTGISSPVVITDFKANTTNKVKIISVYSEDTTYNNEIEVAFGAQFTPILATPTISKENIYVNNYEDGTGDVPLNNVVEKIKLKWTKIPYVTGYILRDNYKIWDNDNQKWDHDETVQYPDREEFTVEPSNLIGEHHYTIQAITTRGSGTYDSKISQDTVLEQNYPLPKPLITHTKPNTYITVLEPIPTNNPNETDPFKIVTQEAIDNIDFYSLQLVPNGAGDVIFLSDIPEKYPFEMDFYDKLKDLTESQTYIASAFSRSYNAFYFHPSEDSDTHFSVEVEKLNKPEGLNYEETTSVLTWTGDDRAFEYEVAIKALDGVWQYYKVKEPQINFTEKNGSPLASNVYSVYVTALRDDSNRNLPVYLDSVKSNTLTFGLINIPKDFSRHLNQFSWTPNGADRYIFYEYLEANEENGIIPDSLLVLKRDDQGNIVYDENNEPVYIFKYAEGSEVPTHKAVSLTTVDGGGASLYLGMEEGDLYRPTEGTHYYSVQAAVSIENSGFSDSIQSQIKEGVIYSLLTDPIKITVEYLKTPQPKFVEVGSSEIKWDILNPNTVFDTRINNISEKDETNDTDYTLNKDEPGSYFFKVRAKSTIDEFLYQTSSWSDELLYNVIKLNRPQISLTKEEATKKYTFTWDAVSNATNYYIHVNKDGQEDFEFNVNENKFEYFALEGMYSIYVISQNNQTRKNPKYIDSEMSNMKKFGVLKAPENVVLNENIVSWDTNPLVDYYEIYNYEKKFAETDRNMFELDVSKPYSYSISVVARSLEEDIFASARSSSVEYIVTKLDAPTGVRIEENVLSYGLVTNADGYRIYIDDELAAITSTTRFDVGSFLSVRAGIVKIHVVAYSNKINFIESDNSNFVLKRIEKEKRFNIVINEINYDKIQLPFSMNFTLDEKLDTAGITLAYIDVKEPFEKLTPADIVIYESGIKSRRFPMVVASDKVEEIKIKNEVKYKHHLQLIERTLILQNEIIPDFSISSSVRDFLIRSYEVESPYIGTNTAVSNKTTIAYGTFDEVDISFIKDIVETFYNILDFLNIPCEKMDLSELDDKKIPTGYVWFKGISPKGNIENVVPKNLKVGETFLLPRPNTRLNCICFSARQIINWIINVVFGDSAGEIIGSVGGTAVSFVSLWLAFKDFWFLTLKESLGVLGKISIIVRILVFLIDYIIYIIKIASKKEGYTWEGLLEKLMTTDLSIIGDCFYTDNDWAFPGRVYKIRPHHGGYEPTDEETPIATFDTSLKNEIGKYSFNRAGSYDLILEIPEVDYQELYKNDLIDFDMTILPSGENTTLPKAHFMKDKNGNPTLYRVIWSDIKITGQTTDPSKYLKISDVLEKVAELANNKYIIDPKIMEYTNTLNCPDMTFSNGNYLYDVLETIGREFSGLPRLLEDNIITFDILDVNTDSTKYMSFWTDTDVLGTESQDLENVAAGFISRVSNMVPDEDYTIHPAPGMWCYPRSDNKEYAATYLEHAAIAVDRPIYKIGKVLVKNAIIETASKKVLEDFELDITSYVYEGTTYNALNNNAKGKGLALVWTQGDKYIRGLGQIPEVTAIRAALGLSETEYVIEKIVKDYINKNLSTNAEESYDTNKPVDMLFQVEYQGYANTTFYIENPDKKTNKYAMYNVFNQEDNTISDTRFGNGAVTVLKRHNTTSIQKSYQAYTLLRLPLLGESITIKNTPYYIDDLTYEFNNGYTIANCNFSKNYNKINPRTAVNSEYRQYELRSDNIVKRITNFNEYCMIGSKENNIDGITRENVWKNIVMNSLNGDAQIKPECLYINCYNSEDLDKIPYVTSNLSGDIITKNIEGIALPISYNRLGLSVSFNASMVDNFTAGYSSRKENDKDGNLERIQWYVRYVGDETLNQIPYMRATLGSLSTSIKNHSYTEDGRKLTFADSFPGVMWLDQPVSSLNDVCFSKFFKVYKDQREALGFNYQMHFVSNREDIVLHRGLTKYLFKQPYMSGKNVKPILVGYNSDITNKDVFTATYDAFNTNMTNDGEKLLFSNFVSTNNYKGLALIWPDTKEILLEIRQPITAGETVSVDPIYFNFTNKIKR